MSDAVLRLKMSIASLNNRCDYQGDKYGEEVTFQVVFGPEGSPNEQWSGSYAQCQFSMVVQNPNAFGKLVAGQFYFVDLIPTTKDAV